MSTYAPYNLISAAANRTRDYLTARIEPDGAFRDICDSRVLESALYLRLLRMRKTHERAQRELAAYLYRIRPTTPLDRIARDSAFHRVPVDTAQELLDAFHHPAGSRKRRVLAAILVALGAPPRTVSDAPPHPRKQAAWTSLALCAADILTTRSPRRSSARGIRRRLRTARAGEVWQGNALAHLLALHALHTVDPLDAVTGTGVEALERIRNHDGGMPFISGQEVFVTALAVSALMCSGYDRTRLARCGDFLADCQLADGGWGYTAATTQSDVDDTARCMEALHALAPDRYRDALNRGRRYLRGMASPSGGFPTYVSHHELEADMTAGAIIALAPLSLPATLRSAAEWLVGQQCQDGTFPATWTIGRNSVSERVLHALSLTGHGAYADCAGRTIRALEMSQNPDGGWGQFLGDSSDILSTAHAVCAVAHYVRPPKTALDYLLDQQRHDGSYVSPADQVGPRPIPFNYPALSSIHALRALSTAPSVRSS
ncbi:prenyltransferase/squalene oxidase repeat-containing protein [Streptomyces gilvosporeus]|nr:prenyltransferase/squalene oxidase repeat-containing protein [Streptomyces gilvosporeus]